MSSFDSGAFDSGGFDAALPVDVTATVSRAAAEVVGTFAEATLTRAVAETLMEPVLARAVLSRVAVEVLDQPPPYFATMDRMAVEVLAVHAFVPPVPSAELTRAVAEVLGTAAEVLGKYATASRAVVEVLASEAGAHQGLILPSVEVDAVTVALAFDPDTTAPGYFALQTPSGDGYSLSWASAAPANLTETWKSGGTVVTSSIPTPSGKLVRVFQHAGTGNALQFTDLGIVRPDGKALAGTLGELMVWNRTMTAAEATRLSAYLTCKWVTPGCDPTVSAPFPACVT